MAAIFAQVADNAAGAGQSGDGGGGDRIGLFAAPGLPQGGNMININAKLHRVYLCICRGAWLGGPKAKF